MLERTSLLVAIAWLWPATASAQPHAWPFDFDPSVSSNPARVNQRLGELGAGLPGLAGLDMTELTVGPVDLYFFADTADALVRANQAGPQLMPPVPRTPIMCARHAQFSMPALGSSGFVCDQLATSIRSAYDDLVRTCREVEFPETYVHAYEQPAGLSQLTEVTKAMESFDGMIAYAGEALTHIDNYWAGLLPDDFFAQARPIIAKLRYDGLRTAIAERITNYEYALDQLQQSSSCFDAAAAASLGQQTQELIAELEAADQYLENLYAAGVAEAQQDRAAVIAQGRVRGNLIHPALTDRERELLAFYIGGVYWRMRGAALLAYPPDPGQGTLRRYLYVRYPYQLIGELAGGIIDADSVGNDTFIQENYGYADWMDMGRSPGNDKYNDLIDMTGRGKEQVELLAPRLANRGYDTAALVAGGLQMGPCYYYGWEVLESFRFGEDLQDPYMWFIESPTAVGEFCTGASLALGLARTLLAGKPGVCTPECTDRECGYDNCTGSCGTCSDGEQCNAAGVCEACAPGESCDADGGDSAGDGADLTGDEPGGCCQTDSGPAGPLAVTGFVLLARPRRRRGRTACRSRAR